VNGPWYSFNGELRPVAQAQIPADDLAFAYGFGVYETLKVRAGVLHFAPLHEQRLWHSAQILGLEHPWKPGDFERFLRELVAANAVVDANVKALLIGGDSAAEARLFGLCLNPLFPDRKAYNAGAHAITWAGERIYPQAKSLNMLTSYLAYREAKAKGAYDALLVNRDGQATEGTRTNLFVTDGVKIYTPPAAQVLAGVTKLTVHRVIRSLGLELVERVLPAEELTSWQGVFLTSTSTKVMPLSAIDGRSVTLSPLVTQIRHAYDAFLKSYQAGQISDAEIL
jgi:branched-subunit amino acid aminotransferase/4-amino-4-deoxychorismate lyase